MLPLDTAMRRLLNLHSQVPSPMKLDRRTGGWNTRPSTGCLQTRKRQSLVVLVPRRRMPHGLLVNTRIHGRAAAAERRELCFQYVWVARRHPVRSDDEVDLGVATGVARPEQYLARRGAAAGLVRSEMRLPESADNRSGRPIDRGHDPAIAALMREA